jgi:hypothetical protein
LAIGDRKRLRASQKKAIHCPVTSLVAVIEDSYIRFEFPKKNPEEWPEHNHSLDWCDTQKINKAIRDALFQEVIKGYKVASIHKLFIREWQKVNRIYLERYRGKYLSLKHIHNVRRDFHK